MKIVREKDQKVWITSDLHFNHANIIKYCDRPFKDIYEMEEELIDRHNEVVGPDDWWIHLGDICFGNRKVNDTIQNLHGMKGKKILIRGNHDPDYTPDDLNVLRELARVEGVYDYLELRTQAIRSDNQIRRKVNLVLFHYPIVQWNGKQHNVIHLHGHSHGSFDYETAGLKDAKIMDVGVDGNNYYPYDLDEIYKMMKGKSVEGLDHHDQNTN